MTVYGSKRISSSYIKYYNSFTTDFENPLENKQ